MPIFTPVDHDPFADDAPAPAAPSSAAPISFSDAPSGGGGPAFVPVDHDPFADDGGDARPLTVRGPRPTLSSPIGGSAVALPAGFSSSRANSPAPLALAAPAAPTAPIDDGSLSYDQAFPSPTPHPGGLLSNSQDDGYLSGAAKGTGTAIIKGVGDAVGAYGGMSSLADYVIARAESAHTGKPIDEVQAAHAAKLKAFKAEQGTSVLGRLALASDPANVLPSPGDVSGPILARTGEYVPQSEPGKIAQAGVEAAVGAFGPGGGMISPGTAGKAVVGALARQAPTMATAGAIGQGVTDYTGDPLLGLGAGLVGAPLAEAGLSKAGSALAPVVGGSKLLNAAPVIGPAIQRARGNEVARTILGQADDPAAVRAAVAQPAADPAIPNSPQTFAGQIGDDQGLFEAEKALRNTKAEKPINPDTGQANQGPTYFNAVDRGQSAAQVAAIQGMRPTGDVFRPGQAISARMDAINGAADDAIARITAAHNDAVAGRAGATQSFVDGASADLAARQADRTQAGTDFAGQQRADLADRTVDRGQASGDAKAAGDALRQAQHDAMVQRLSDALAGQQGAAQDAAGPLAGGPLSANDLGGSLRSSIEAVRATQKGLHRDLYAQVDPNNSLAMVATSIGDRATGIATDLTSRGGELAPAEAGLFNRAAALPDVASYSMVHQLDTDLSAAMSTERRASGESPAWARLSQLKSAVKGAMNDAADNHAAWEQRQVAAGAMAPEDTIAGRLGADRNEFRDAQQPQARAATGTDDGGYGAPRTSPVFEVPGAEIPGGGGSRNAPRDPGLSGPGGRGTASQALSPADLESRTFHQAVPAESGHRIVPVDADKVDVLTGWQPDYRIAPGTGGPGGKLARASDFVQNLGEGQDFRPPVLGVHDQGMGFTDGRHRFSAMRDLGLKTVPVSMDAASEAAARRLGLVNDAPPRPGAASRRSAGRTPAPQGASSPSIIDDVTRQAVAAGRPEEEARAAGALQDAYYRTRAARFGGARGTAEDLYRAEGPTIGAMKPTADFTDNGKPLKEQMNARLSAAQAAAPTLSAAPDAPFNPAIHPDLIEAGNHVIHRVRAGDDTRFYRVYPRPADGLDGVSPGDLGDKIGGATLARHPDGRWEVGNVSVNEGSRRQGIARKLYGAIEQDLGIKMQPSGQLMPDGYRMWLDRDPEAVKWHQEVDGAYWSPKALAGAYGSSDTGQVAQATRAAYDALPPEAKTPETLRKMFQDGAAGPRGEVRFASGERPQIGVGRDADASTIPHEMSHAWFEDLIADAKHPAAPDALRADARTLLDHVGSTDGVLNPIQHERLAQGLEQYLRDGKAPTPALGRVFGQFKDWLGKIYQTMRGPGAEVSADVRGVYGRMLDGGGPAREVGTGPRPDAPAYDPDGVRAPPRPDVPRPQDLRAFVRSRGGMIDTGGDLASMGLHELIGRGARAVSPDRMREAAAEAGYLGADTARAMRETHPNDLLDALSGDRPVHSVRDEDAAAAWAAHDDARERYDAARGEFGTRSKFGVVPEPAPLDSYSREDIEGPNGPQAREPAASGLTPTFGPEAAGRLKAANAAYAQYARTYKNPTVGPGLRTTGYAGQFARSDAAFIKGAIKPGAEGYENARAYLAAAKSDPDALGAMHDAVLNPLRNKVLGHGMLRPDDLARWKSADGYGPALRALDEVTPGFSGRFDDAGKATQALLDLGQAHKAQLATAQQDAARQAIVDNLQRKDALRQATAGDKATVSRLLADRKAGDRMEGQADRRGVASSIADRKATDSTANAQSRAQMQAGTSAARGMLQEARATPAAQFAGKAGGAIAATEVENAVASFLKTGTNGTARMRSLVQSVASEPEALDGLRKAATDWMVRSHSNADGTLSGANLIKFLRANTDTLHELFPHSQRIMFGALARDAEDGMRWRTSTAVKGGSDSVKNLLASLDSVKGGLHKPTVGYMAIEALALGWEKLEQVGPKMAAAGAGAAVLGYLGNSLRSAGIRNTANLYREAMANPELARALISKMPASPEGGALHNLARVLRRGTMVAPMLTRQAEGAN